MKNKIVSINDQNNDDALHPHYYDPTTKLANAVFAFLDKEPLPEGVFAMKSKTGLSNIVYLFLEITTNSEFKNTKNEKASKGDYLYLAFDNTTGFLHHDPNTSSFITPTQLKESFMPLTINDSHSSQDTMDFTEIITTALTNIMTGNPLPYGFKNIPGTSMHFLQIPTNQNFPIINRNGEIVSSTEEQKYLVIFPNKDGHPVINVWGNNEMFNAFNNNP